MLDKNVIWEEIIKEAQERVKPLQDGEMTVKMFTEQTGLGHRWASSLLEQMVVDKKLTKRYATINAHRTTVYYPITQ